MTITQLTNAEVNPAIVVVEAEAVVTDAEMLDDEPNYAFTVVSRTTTSVIVETPTLLDVQTIVFGMETHGTQQRFRHQFESLNILGLLLYPADKRRGSLFAPHRLKIRHGKTAEQDVLLGAISDIVVSAQANRAVMESKLRFTGIRTS